MRKRGCIVTKLLAKMMCKGGFTHIITMDLHAKEIQGFFDVPIDNLRASPFLLQYVQDCVSNFFTQKYSPRRGKCHARQSSIGLRSELFPLNSDSGC